MRVKKSKKKKQLNSYIQHSSLTTKMAAIIIGGVFFGEFLDEKFHSKTPVYTIILSLSSVFLALYYVLKNITNQNGKK